jgi:hypothetical protein
MSSSVPTKTETPGTGSATQAETGRHQSAKICVLYSSWSAQPDDIGLASNIMRFSRERNEARGIHGALVFDGEIFVQLLHGEKASVRALQTSIWRDSRHRAILLLHDGPVTRTDVPAQWRAGWAAIGALRLFRHAPAAQEDRLAEFLALLPTFDLL